VLGVWLAVALALVGAPAASAAPPAQVGETYLITFKAGTDPDAQAAQLRAQGRGVKYVYRNVFPGVAVTLPPAALPGMRANPRVQRIEADAEVTISDVRTNATWGIDRTDQRNLPLDSSFTYRTSAGAGVYAYIIDTGIRSTHSELGGRVVGGYTAIADSNGTNDCNGHGTHVAGTVAGSTYGMANRATLVPVRVLDCGGSGSWSGVVAGLDYVAGDTTRRPAVANMSLGGGVTSTVNDAVQRAIAAGVTVAVAAGNENTDACTRSPASAPNAITVGATANNDARASFSNYGTCVDLFGPGVNITSSWITNDTSLNTISGTSMATPHVAGAVALILGDSPTLTPAQVTATMLAAATPNKVTSPGTGSPNLLLYADPGALPPPPPVPANDPFATPEVLTPSASGSTTANTLMASKEASEPNHAGNGGGASVWYSFTPSADGVLVLSTEGSSFNTLLAVYTGSSLGGLTSVASNDDSGGGLSWSSVAFAATSGTTYRIAVDGYGGNKGSVALGWTFGNQVAVTTSSLPNGTSGVAYSAQLAAIGGTGPLTWSLDSGSLPAGLSLSSGGLISGTPTVSGSSTFAVSVTDGSTTATKTLSITLAVPPPPNDNFSAAQAVTLSASGSLTGSNVNATKETGEPTHAGVGGGTSVWYTVAPAVDGVITLTTQGSAFDTALAVYTGSAVNGLSVVGSNDDSGGGLWSSVTFAAAAATTYRVAVDGYAAAEGAVTLNWTYDNSVVITTASLPAGSVNTAYSAQLTAIGGTGSYTWTVTAGALPTGLTLSSGGAITGTPTASGTATFTVSATDGSVTGTKTLSIAIGQAAPVNDGFSAAMVITPSASGSTPGTTISATKETGEPLHAGNSGGKSVWYTLTPTAAGSVTLSTSGSGFDTLLAVYTGSAVNGLTQVAANDDNGSGGLWSLVTFTAVANTTYRVAIDGYGAASGSTVLGWTIATPLSVTTASLAPGTTGTAYSATLAAAGGTGTYSWALASGSLPAGVTLAADGTISGTPTAAGTASFTVRVTSGAATATKALSIVVTAPVTVSTSTLAGGVTGTAYSAGLAATGGTTPYTWSIDSGSLPAGLSLAGNVISGTPSAAGTASFTVRATDSIGRTGTRALSIAVVEPVVISTSSLPSGVTGRAYSTALGASGGTGTYTWAMVSGTLPAGLTLSTAGVISGTPTTAGTSSFSLKATSGAAQTTKALSIVVTAPLAVSTTTLAAATINTGYTATLASTGGTGPNTWAVISGSLPTGLSLSGSTISGTPTATGTFSFTVQVTDSLSATASKVLAITVGAGTVPGTFSKTSPVSNARNQPRASLTFTWAAATGATSYEFCISTTTTCTGTGASGWISTGTNRSITRTALASKRTYYWQVRAVNGAGATLANSGTYWKFQTIT